MFTRILVSLDGSARAEHLVPVAAQIARTADRSSVLLMWAKPHSAWAWLSQVVSRAVPKVLDRNRLAAEGYITRVADLPVLSGISTETHVRLGQPFHELTKTAEARHCDLLVLSNLSHSTLLRWDPWSFTGNLIWHLPIPLLLIGAHSTLLAEPGFNTAAPFRVLVPLDGSPVAEAVMLPALELATALAGTRPVALHLVLVMSPMHGFALNASEALTRLGARVYLKRLSRRLETSRPQVRVTWQVKVIPNHASTVRTNEERAVDGRDGGGPSVTDGTVRTDHIDLIVIATHRTTDTQRLSQRRSKWDYSPQDIQGVWKPRSIAECLLRCMQVPLLILPTLAHSADAGIEKEEVNQLRSDQASIMQQEKKMPAAVMP